MDEMITKQVVGAVAQVLRKPEEEILVQASFADLGADELDMFELILKFEDTFTLEITDDEAQQLISVEKVVSYVAQKGQRV